MDQKSLGPAQVGASTAAAVGAAFLASRLGVYGTIIGVGVISLMSTVGSEMLLRSLDRTKQVARAANRRQRTGGVSASAAVDPPGDTGRDAPTDPAADTVEAATTIEQPERAALPDRPAVPDEPSAPGPQPSAPDTLASASDDQPSWAKRRWLLIAGGSLASFGLAMAVITGIETFTGQALDGSDSPTVVSVFRGAGQGSDDAPPVPATPTGDSTPAQEDDGTSPGGQGDGTAPQPDPTTPTENQPPGTGNEMPLPDQETTPSDENETPPSEEQEPPPDDDAPDELEAPEP